MLTALGITGLAIIGARLLLLCRRLCSEPGGRKAATGESYAYTLILLCGIGATWFQASQLPARAVAATDITSQQALAQYLSGHSNAPGDTRVMVPTGIFIQGLELPAPNRVRLSGYLWQRVPGTAAKAPGALFPEAEASEWSDAYREEQNGKTVQGWYFETHLRQASDPGHFPLDRRIVSLRLWPKDLSTSTALIPDLEHGDSRGTGQFPGIEDGLVIRGWEISATRYSFREHHYNTSFGKAASSGATEELHFEIDLHRRPLPALFTWVLPVAVVALLLRILLRQIPVVRATIPGTDWPAASLACLLLILALLTVQLAMREETGAGGLVYADYLYLLTMLACALVGANARLLQRPDCTHWLTCENHLLPRLVFWPSLSAAYLLVSLLVLTA